MKLALSFSPLVRYDNVNITLCVVYSIRTELPTLLSWLMRRVNERMPYDENEFRLISTFRVLLSVVLQQNELLEALGVAAGAHRVLYFTNMLFVHLVSSHRNMSFS